jgi:CRISPR type III-B/RAMP module RAMP protein Cmr6
MTAYGALARFDVHSTEINAELLRTRLWHATVEDDRLVKDREQEENHLRQVAAAARHIPPGLLEALHARRWATARALADRRAGHVMRSLLITPWWRVVVGHGEDSPHESGLSFSATYGLPMWPASGLKGAAAAQARASGVNDEDLGRLFGTPRPTSTGQVEAHRGMVTVLDAFPVRAPDLVVDVLTPHVKPYYDQANTDPERITQPPAEYHNPVPVRFLAVADTPFRTVVIGPADETRRFVDLLTAAADDIGLGGKTAAGYGYCTVIEETSAVDGPR